MSERAIILLELSSFPLFIEIILAICLINTVHIILTHGNYDRCFLGDKQ
jgi:hypothetical protein